MSKHQIVVVVGSLRRESWNKKLANALMAMGPADFAFQLVRIDDLPLYNQDDDAQQAPNVKRLKSEIQAAHGVIFVTPEYNRSIPGVLKNAIDHASRPYGQNAWAGKPAGVIGASIGPSGTSMAQQHLRNVLAYLDVPTMGQPETFLKVKDGWFDKDGKIADADGRASVQKWMDQYVAWVKRIAPGGPLPVSSDSGAGSKSSESAGAKRSK